MNSVELYLKLSRIVFGQDECAYLKNYDLIFDLHKSLTCFQCLNLITNPIFDQKQQKFGCAECLGESDNNTETSRQFKIILKCYKELCEYIKNFCGDINSLEDEKSSQLLQLVEIGSRYGVQETKQEEVIELRHEVDRQGSDKLFNEYVVSPAIQESNEDGDDEREEEEENDCIEEQPEYCAADYQTMVPVPLSMPAGSPTPPASSNIVEINPPITIVQSSNPMILPNPATSQQVPDIETQIPNIITLIPPSSPAPQQIISQQPITIPHHHPQVISASTQSTTTTTSSTPVQIPISVAQLPQHPTTLVQYQNSQTPVTSNLAAISPKKITISPSSMTGKPLSTYMGSLGKPLITTNSNSSPTIAPIKITRISQSNDSTTRTIYSVMYTGAGNKITIKRKTADDIQEPVNKDQKIMSAMHLNSSIKNVDMEKSGSSSSVKPQPPTEFKKPIQIYPNPGPMQQQTATNVINPLKLLKRKGCRCGNATATPGKLTCCGQRCPCYVESKACIDCKCRGCRNPHFKDGQKKIRHHVPDSIQQFQQQSYFASLQQSLKQTSQVSHPPINQSDYNSILDNSSTSGSSSSKSVFSNNSISSSTNLINVSSNYQIVPQKSLPKTISPIASPMTSLMFPTSTTGTTVMSNYSGKIPTTGGIQIVNVYSQIPGMMANNKLLMKTEPTAQNMESASTEATKPSIPQTTYYLEKSSDNYILTLHKDPYDTSELNVDQKDVIIEEV